MSNEFHNSFKEISERMRKERHRAAACVFVAMVITAGAIIGLVSSLKVAESIKPQVVSVDDGYLACVTPEIARQSLVADSVQNLVNENLCLPTANFSKFTVNHSSTSRDMANITLEIDDAAYSLWIPVEAIK